MSRRVQESLSKNPGTGTEKIYLFPSFCPHVGKAGSETSYLCILSRSKTFLGSPMLPIERIQFLSMRQMIAEAVESYWQYPAFSYCPAALGSCVKRNDYIYSLRTVESTPSRPRRFSLGQASCRLDTQVVRYPPQFLSQGA